MGDIRLRGWLDLGTWVELEHAGLLNLPETLEHLLLWCPAFNETRTSVIRLWLSCSNHDIHNIVSQVLQGPPEKLLKFILDPSANPSVISLYQVHGDEVYQLVFHLTRTWCFALHKVRSQKLGIWPKLWHISVIHSNLGIGEPSQNLCSDLHGCHWY